MNYILKHLKTTNQYAASIFSIATASLICLLLRDVIDYKAIAYILLVVVSLLAVVLDLAPVLLAAVLSALILNYFFIRPYYTFHITSASDALLLLLFFIIAMINGVLTYKIRKAQRLVQIKETKWNTMKLYNTLLDSLSHELRTPIATIMGGVGTLQEKSSHLSDANKAALLSEMEKASMRLNHQVENLLNMSRLESGYVQAKLDWCDMNELVYKVIDSLSEELSGHKIIVSKNEGLPLFKLDYGLMEQILYNLIYNASQYTPKGAQIEVGIEFVPVVNFEYDDSDNYSCVITVSDDGKGFPENEISKAFDKFYRTESSKTGGTGLGLSIVKGFTEAQEGQVILRNKEEGGAVFTLSFPAPVMQLKEISNE